MLLFTAINKNHSEIASEKFFKDLLRNTLKLNNILSHYKKADEFQQLCSKKEEYFDETVTKFINYYYDKINNYALKRKRICQLFLLKNMLPYNTVAENSLKQSIYDVID